MISQVYSFFMMFKVLLVFVVLYIVIPARVIHFEKESKELLDKVFISIIHFSLLTILIIHFLVSIKIYETISLIIAYLVIYFVIVWVRGRTPLAMADAAGLKAIVSILDMSEGRLGLIGTLKAKLKDGISNIIKGAKDYLKYFFTNPFAGCLSIAVLFHAAYIRFHHSLTHFYLGASDSYVVLAWTKYLGNNSIYQDGIYPYGIEAIISSLNKVFLIDPYYITRFIGPLAGFLIVLSVYYVLKKNFRNPHLVWIAILIYGTVNDGRLLSDTWRQISALPQEFSMIFFLPGLHFFNMYINTNKRYYLLLSGECVALTLLIHPYVTVFLGSGLIIIALLNITSFIKKRTLINTSLVMIGSILLGFIPLIIAYLFGLEFHGSLGYIQASVTMTKEKVSVLETLKSFKELNPFILIFLYSSLIIFLSFMLSALFNKRIKSHAKTGFIFILTGFLFYILFRARSLGLPEIMDAGRIGIFLSMLMIVNFALLVYIFDILFKGKVLNQVVKTIYCIIVFFMVVNYTAWGVIPKGFQMEYDEAVYNYINISKNTSAFNWTIIAPVEQYQQSLGYGWHYELWKFVYEQSNPYGEELTIPTDYIFLFVEKLPLHSDEYITVMDAEQSFPPLPNMISEIYNDTNTRRILQAKAYFWAEDYIIRHDNITVYFENERYIVYQIVQDGKEPINLLY